MRCGEPVIWYEHSIDPDLVGWKHVSPATWRCGTLKYHMADVDLSQQTKETCLHCDQEIRQEQSIVKDGGLIWKHTHGGWRACNNNMSTHATPKSASILSPNAVVNIEKKSPKSIGYNTCFYCGEAIEKRFEGEYKGHWAHVENQDTWNNFEWNNFNRWSCASKKTFDGQWHVADCLLDPGPNTTIKVTKETKTVVTKTQTVTYTVQVNDKLSVPENKGRKFRIE
jgi:hypothetical protein